MLVLVVPDLQINIDPLPLFLASYAMVQVRIQEELREGWERILGLGLNMGPDVVGFEIGLADWLQR